MARNIAKVIGTLIMAIAKKAYKYLIEDIASKILDIFWNKVDPVEVTT